MPGHTLPSLVDVMERLLAPDGCPWDREQTLKSLEPYLIEEAHEVIEAIDGGDPARHREELGDLLFQVVFQSALATRQEGFDIDAVIGTIREKLVRRHPHIFGDVQVQDAREQVKVWERVKAEERAEQGQTRRALAGVPRALPSLQRAWRLGEKAGAVGFDWRDAPHVLEKVREEIAEMEQALAAGDRAAIASEIGDVCFSLAQLARHLGFDPETALRETNDRFVRRFQYIEDRLAERGRTTADATADEMEDLWKQAKQALS